MCIRDRLIAYHVWVLIHICWWIKFNPASSAFMAQSLDGLQVENPDAELKHQWVDYAKISNNLKRAVIASEDAKFVDHEGFDWEGIEHAYEKNLKKGARVISYVCEMKDWEGQIIKNKPQQDILALYIHEKG
jgi:membrane peptidoglycan carboxypeptidase